MRNKENQLSERGEIELNGRQTIIIPEKAWEKLMAWINEPPKEIPALRRLANSRPQWKD